MPEKFCPYAHFYGHNFPSQFSFVSSPLFSEEQMCYWSHEGNALWEHICMKSTKLFFLTPPPLPPLPVFHTNIHYRVLQLPLLHLLFGDLHSVGHRLIVHVVRSLLPISVPRFRGEVLKMRKIKRGQMGAYLCIASNDVPPAVSKRIILNVNCEHGNIFSSYLGILCKG